MKSFSLTLLAIIILATSTRAQTGNFTLNTNTGSILYNDASSMGNKPADVSYRDVSGKYLWSEEWTPGLIIMKANNAIKMRATRVNLYTNEINYKNDNAEMAAAIDKVKRVVLYDNADSTKVVAVFDVLIHGSTKSAFYEVLNDGKVGLLRRVSVEMKKERFDPVTGTDQYHFKESTDYFIRIGSLKPIKGISKASILEVVPTTPEDQQWLDQNKNKLKRVDDVVEFFNYLNAKDK